MFWKKKRLPLITICSVCKAIKQDGKWIRIEEYLCSYATGKVDVSHGYCKRCGSKLMASIKKNRSS